MLTVEHVGKELSGKLILHDVNLEFERGVYGLLAPNGAGKTTLIKLLATLLTPDAGAIRWDGEDIVGMGERYRSLIGYLPQDFGYYPNHSPRRFLKYIATLQGVPRDEIAPRIDELLAMVHLSDQADRKMRTLSGGMIRRVGIAQALIHRPRILLLDEPTAGLDPKERVRFRNIVHNLAADHIVVIATHIVSDLETIADRIVMLGDATVREADEPAAICERLEGRIYEVPSGYVLHDGQLKLSEIQRGGETAKRIYSPDPIPESADRGIESVHPGLEDAFLLTYRD
ncbi:ABC transporter ATP-binding protein [Bifidobacterium sp. 82T24]|uniref:ATP-binding cassette domain-containing protein n=1 Tax=Bifidobacterium saimiriisciurei TaxID=2661627 RepID=A0ABX0CCT2_9BIFI|nr:MULTISPECIES: ABC transporter ATP-binding protein [Bifidobacterium]MBW3088881.1 ABC transporter ATP-binding protein [Bifidobacterium pluvialisilvae]NEG96267.1 ATP-binding cassette domain-containing protein [Bifidobacterium sp. SMB2]NEH12360.1 ATP-binding cassette domain-containing protein [Bifidobacterium saimiriisciurei]